MKVLAVVMVIVGVSVAYLALVKKQTVDQIWGSLTGFFNPSSASSGTSSYVPGWDAPSSYKTQSTIKNGMTRALGH